MKCTRTPYTRAYTPPHGEIKRQWSERLLCLLFQAGHDRVSAARNYNIVPAFAKRRSFNPSVPLEHHAKTPLRRPSTKLFITPYRIVVGHCHNYFEAVL